MRSIAIQGVQRDLKKQLAHPKVAQPKPGAYSAPSLLLVSITHPARMPDGPAKRPGKYAITRWSCWALVHLVFRYLRERWMVDFFYWIWLQGTYTGKDSYFTLIWVVLHSPRRSKMHTLGFLIWSCFLLPIHLFYYLSVAIVVLLCRSNMWMWEDLKRMTKT